MAKVVKRGWKDPKKPKCPNIYGVTYEKNGVGDVDIIYADIFEIEEAGSLALFFITKEEELERELVCALKDWFSIRKLDREKVNDVTEKLRKFSQQDLENSKSVYDPPASKRIN